MPLEFCGELLHRLPRWYSSATLTSVQQNLDPASAENVPAWADGLDPITYPSLDGDVTADVCVVGLGGSGLSCIHELLDMGQRVVGVDAGTIGGGAAGRNGGFLLAGTAAFYHDAVEALGQWRAKAIYQATLDEIERIQKETPSAVRRTGSLRIADSEREEEDCNTQRIAMLADNFMVDPYNGDEGTGLFFPHDCTFNPLARCRLRALSATTLGARLYEHSGAIAISGHQVRTPSGRVQCKQVIVAVDGRLEYVLPELAGLVRTARLQMLSTVPVPNVDRPTPVYRRWGFDYWQQLPDNRIVLGGCRDRFEDAEWTVENNPTDEVQQCMESVLRNVVGIDAPIEHRWAASVGYTNGILPVMARPRPGVWAIGGYSGTGNVIGSLYGRMIAQYAVTGESKMMQPFMPSGPTVAPFNT
jgi:glycine/D-amino acid oxidase-like deaminating enzyme